ncbi:monocarboxylate transporter 5-like [Ixodes scapularis]|uniref:monocarboxylate transporter 5-like n=1 Tax=Ixodes scapularis TaxID=6945 RepID=UPI001C394C4B|nr:monocarboxylate transporter 5-like [Ixodes scapularis]
MKLFQKEKSSTANGERDQATKAGVDTAWRVAFLAALMAFFEASSFRSSGFLYVAVIDEYQADRGLASWPVSVFGTMIDMGGIVSGPLCQLFGAPATLISGAIITALGMLGASFTKSIPLLTLTLGIIHGAGAGTVSTMLQVFLSMYFDKYRGTAHGIMFAGATMSSFVFPMLLYFLRETFDFQYCLLIFGAILLHLVPISLLFKKPPWVQEGKNRESKLIPESSCATTITIEGNLERAGGTRISTGDGKEQPGIGRKALAILKIPIFYAILVTWTIMCYNEDLFLTTIVDFAKDHGASTATAVPLISYLSITDTLGRIFLPLIADRKLMRRSTLVALNALLTAISVGLLPQATTNASLVVVTLLAACFNGCGMTMYGVLLADYIGIDNLHISYTLAGLTCGPLLFLKPLLVGYFRDQLGSYDNMYRMLAAFQVFLFFLWIAVSYSERRRAKAKASNIEEILQYAPRRKSSKITTNLGNSLCTRCWFSIYHICKTLELCN